MPNPYTRPDVQAFLAYAAANPRPPMYELSPEAARAGMRRMIPEVDLPLGELAVLRELSIPGPAGPLPALLLDTRLHRGPGPVVLWFHGGGFVLGGLDTHRNLAAEVSRQLDLPVVLATYRLAPEAGFPAPPDDAEAAARWVASDPPELSLAVTSLVLAGDSAGGNLAIVTAMALRDAPAAVPVLAHLAFFPATDRTRAYPSHDEFAEGYMFTRQHMQWFRRHYQPPVDDPRASPLLGSLAGMPPAVVMTAGLDPLRDEGRAYAAALVSAGVPTVFLEAAGTVHGFATLRKILPSSQLDVAQALTALHSLVTAAAS